MPIGPNNIGVVRHDLIQRTCYEIDSILKDPVKSRTAVVGDSDDYYYTLVYPGVLSPQEKTTLHDLYMTTGWGKVTVVNSGEVNQRSGLFMVKLYSKADSRYLRN